MAWSMLVRHLLQAEDVVVTAVSSKPVRYPNSNGRVTRYLLALADHTDPITFIGKRASPAELRFYRHLALQMPGLAPRCHFLHEHETIGHGWLVLEDVPDQLSPSKWSVTDVEIIISRMAHLHAAYWRQPQRLRRWGFAHLWEGETFTWEELREEQAVYFEEGPAAILSEHAVQHAGRLAPVLLKAANGLAVMRALGGWPGILGETHLTIAADLLDDPVPMLEPLRHLPRTLLHGSPHPYHWRLSLFEDCYLVDWQKTVIGPSVCDLVNFLEQFDLLYLDEYRCQPQVRDCWPVSEETMVDSYMIQMKQRLGSEYHGRAVRQAIPAARCLYVLTNWFTYFADWFDEMPDMYSWQKINRRPDAELMGTPYEPIARLRPFLGKVFHRFLQAYRAL